MMKRLFLAWHDPESSRWLPVGQLSRDRDDYRFVYTKGAEESENFLPFGRMTNLHAVYVAKELFPLFANRLMPRSRPEYRDFLTWLGLEAGDHDALELLGKSGGARATDALQVFPCPEPTPENTYVVEFFSHGIRHLPQSARDRIGDLKPGERLFLTKDFQNPSDPSALLMRTGEPLSIVGYCPRFYSAEFSKLVDLVGGDRVEVAVSAVNLDAPLQFRLRCRLTAPWPAGFTACSQDAFQPLG
ncbi:hypothetical protein THSYN_22790 [Candidatus Thiodictyon syntrophicum]|jgi:hypothetical protein|uniref:HIRAN domain-containing protein n=2 Tax=Candidatus Thiodictyon syntrophicum TaxID=1166950 RepID=A0A2K8UDD8_9GAMM|nr:hypothetical protein THSYN_22790 [Candidatus Thiodictyon syntrophicum]